MGYQMKETGMEEISKMLDQLKEKAPAIAAKALYDGAGVMSSAIKRNVDSIRTEKFHYAVWIQREVSPEEKDVVQAAKTAGVARFDKDGTEIQTSVGYSNSGYSTIKGRRIPIPMIANSINSGTSFLRKQPFFRKAVNSGSKAAIKAMTEAIETEVKNMTK